MVIIIYCILLKDVILAVSFASFLYIIFIEPILHKKSSSSLGFCLLEVLITVIFTFARNHFSVCDVYVWNKCKVPCHMHSPETV
jgi:hypothetical protein